jgi:hypothetical protein
MKNKGLFPSLHPGHERDPGGCNHLLHVPTSEGQFGRHSASHLAQAEGSVTLIDFGAQPYNNFQLTETKQNTSTILPVAGGIRFATQATPTDGDKVEIESIATVAVSGSSKIQTFIASCRVQISSVANLGISFGFIPGATTGVIAADPSNGVYFRKAKNSANLIGSTIQGGGARHDSGTLLALTDATDVLLTVKFGIGSTAANCSGEFWVNGVKTVFTAAQLTDLFAMVAGNAVFAGHLGFAVNGTTQRFATVAWVIVEADR